MPTVPSGPPIFSPTLNALLLISEPSTSSSPLKGGSLQESGSRNLKKSRLPTTYDQSFTLEDSLDSEGLDLDDNTMVENGGGDIDWTPDRVAEKQEAAEEAMTRLDLAPLEIDEHDEDEEGEESDMEEDADAQEDEAEASQ